MADNDFDQWAPQIVLFGGLGVTGFKVAEEMRAKGTISAPWREQKKAKELVSTIARGQKAQRKVTAGGVLARLKAVGGNLADLGHEDRLAYRNMHASMVSAAMIKRFGLQKEAAKLGLDPSKPATLGANLFDPFGDTGKSRLELLVGQDPTLIKFLEGKTSPAGKAASLDVSAFEPKDPLRLRVEQRQKKAAQRLKAQTKQYGELKTVEEMLKKATGGQELGALGRDFIEIDSTDVRSFEARLKQLGGQTNEATVERVRRLHEKVRGLTDVSMKLRVLTQEGMVGSGQGIITGIELGLSNRPLIDISIQDVKIESATFGRVLQGRAMRPGVARRRMTAESLAALPTPGGLEKVGISQATQALHDYTLDKLLGGELEQLIGGTERGRHFANQFAITAIRDDVGANILPWAANIDLNRRIATQVSLRGEAEGGDLERLMARAREEFGIMGDPSEGLGPSNVVNPVISMRPTIAKEMPRAPGAMPIGEWMGDPKSEAQILRPQSHIASEWSKPLVVGQATVESGIVTPTVRLTSIHPEMFKALIGKVGGRPDIELHPDEILAAEHMRRRQLLTTSEPKLAGYGTTRLEELLAAKEGGFTKEWEEIAGLVESQRLSPKEAASQLAERSAKKYYVDEAKFLKGKTVGQMLDQSQRLAESLADQMTIRYSKAGASETLEKMLENGRKMLEVVKEKSKITGSQLLARLSGSASPAVARKIVQDILAKANPAVSTPAGAGWEGSRVSLANIMDASWLGELGIGEERAKTIREEVMKMTASEVSTDWYGKTAESFMKTHYEEALNLGLVKGGDTGVHLATSYEGRSIEVQPGEELMIRNIHAPAPEVAGDPRQIVVRGIKSEKMGEGWKAFGAKATLRSYITNESTQRMAEISELLWGNPETRGEFLSAVGKLEVTGTADEGHQKIERMVEEARSRLGGIDLAPNQSYRTSVRDLSEGAVETARKIGQEAEWLGTAPLKKVGERELTPFTQAMADELALIHEEAMPSRNPEALREQRLWSRLVYTGDESLAIPDDLAKWSPVNDLVNRPHMLPLDPAKDRGLMEQLRTTWGESGEKAIRASFPDLGPGGVMATVASPAGPIRREITATSTQPHAVGETVGRIKEVFGKMGGEYSPQRGQFVIGDDLRADPDQNIIRKFHHAARGLSAWGVGDKARWRMTSLIENLEVAEAGFTSEAREKLLAGVRAAEQTIFNPPPSTTAQAVSEARDVIGETYRHLEKTLGEQSLRVAVGQEMAYGTKTRHIGLGENPGRALGSGRLAAFNEQIANNLMQQGGVMKDIALELAGRARTSSPGATELIRALGVAHQKGGMTGALTLADLARYSEEKGVTIFPETPADMRTQGKQGLLATSPHERRGNIGRLREFFGMAEDSPIIVDMGEGLDQRFAYLMEGQYEGLTSSYTPAGGKAVVSSYDQALARLMQGVAATGDTTTVRNQAVAEFKDSLDQMARSKTGPLAQMYKGKVAGGLQQQAQGGLGEDVIKAIENEGADTSVYRQGVGLREEDALRMAQDAGMGAEESRDFIKSLRKGDEAAVIARFPQTELHRATPMRLFSVDKALEDYVGAKLAQDPSSGGRMLKAVMGRGDYRKFRKDLVEAGTLEEFTPGEGKVDSRFNTHLRNNPKAIVDELLKTYSTGRAFFKFNELGELIHASPLGLDTDADQVQVFLAKDKKIRQEAAALAKYNSSLAENFVGKKGTIDTLEQFLTDQRVANEFKDLTAQQQNIYSLAEANLTYKAHQKELFGALVGQGDPAPIEEATVKYGADGRPTAEMRGRHRAAAVLARLEKKDIGTISNIAEFTRDTLRKTMDAGRTAVIQEALIGILPEIPLKAKKTGTVKSVEQGRPGLVQEMIDVFQDVSGDTIEDSTQRFTKAFRALHDTVDENTLNTLLDQGNNNALVEDIMRAAVEQKKRGEYGLHRLIRSGGYKAGGEDTLQSLMRYLGDPASESKLAITFSNEMASMGIKPDNVGRHKANVERTVGNFWSSVNRHKKPLLIGAGIAIAGAMLMGSPGHVSEDEANNARSIHKPAGDPSHPAIVKGNSARLNTGTSIRIRGRSQEDLDYSAISSRLNDSFPRANIGYNVIDQSETINDEYVRRALMR